MSEETIPQMREQIDKLTSQLKDANKTNSGLTTENRVLKARDYFRNLGFRAEGGELYAAQNPEGEITEEAVKNFVEKYGVGAVAPEAGAEGEANAGGSEGGSEGEPAPGASSLSNLSRGGSGAGEGGADGSSGEPMTRDEWKELHATDPAAAQLAVRQGRVQISKDNVFSGVNPGLKNPYVPRPA